MNKLKIHHIAITTRDLEMMRKFYESLPGFSKAEKQFEKNGELRSLWFRIGEILLMIEKGKTRRAPYSLVFELKKWKEGEIRKLKKN